MLALAPSRESRSRTLLLPQPEGLALEVLIEAIGAPELSLREIDEALRRLRGKLRRGQVGGYGRVLGALRRLGVTEDALCLFTGVLVQFDCFGTHLGQAVSLQPDDVDQLFLLLLTA
jgi:hypothetical protein